MSIFNELFQNSIYEEEIFSIVCEPNPSTGMTVVNIEKHGLEQNDIVHLRNGNVFDMMPELVFQNQNSIINCQNKIKKDGNYELVVNSEIKYPISFNYNRKESQNIFSLLVKRAQVPTKGNYL